VWLLRDHHDHRGPGDVRQNVRPDWMVGDHLIVRRKMKGDVRQNVRPDWMVGDHLIVRQKMDERKMDERKMDERKMDDPQVY
jgi:hypothetical protein